ncbi:ATP-binding cassette domain-containing protein [Microlunatus sp. GCM10028923]|uniref:ATP-binding cassette domain-containing protein n=1 Tax=Microlunatus sp. GCM10028923 TaxID=3273400 RepID=UPI003622998A
MATSVRIGTALADVAFVTRHAFAADRRSATAFAVLSLVLAALPAAQVAAIATLINRLREASGLGELAVPLLVVVVAVALATPLTAVASAVEERAMLSTELRLQSMLAEAVARLAPSRLADPAVAAEVEGHTHSVIDAVSHVYGRVVSGLGSAAAAVAVVITVASMSPVAALLVVLATVPVILAGRYVSRAAERMWALLGPAYQRDRYLRETMSRQRSITELASLGTSHRLAAMVIAQQTRTIEARNLTVRARIRSQLLVGLSGIVLLGAAVLAIIVGLDYGPDAVAGIYGVIAAMGASAAGSVSLAEVLQFLPRTTAVRTFLADAPPARPHPIATSARTLRVTGLRHRYADRDTDAVAGIGFEAHRGEMIALVGVNGAGKTTTVQAILGLIEPTAGLVTVDGRTRVDLGEAAWLGQFGLLTQEFGRYEFTVRDAVALGRPDEDFTDDELWAALDAARAGDFVRTMPDGLDTQLGEQWGGVGISGGQWQRLALARIQLRAAPIWILDEPTSAIDAEAEQEVFAELGRNRDDRITIVVSHRAWTLRAMDRINVIDNGEIVEAGSYADLVAAGGRFAAIFAEQA